MKNCVKCGKEIPNRNKFCSDHCKWWYNSIKKDNERHLPPFRKRNKNYFAMVTGSEWAKSSSRQGRRSGGTIMGSMSAMIPVATEEIVEVNKDNLDRHFKGIPGFTPVYIRLGDETRIKKENIYKEFGIKLN